MFAWWALDCSDEGARGLQLDWGRAAEICTLGITAQKLLLAEEPATLRGLSGCLWRSLSMRGPPAGVLLLGRRCGFAW
jgi:hypothetical protein